MFVCFKDIYFLYIWFQLTDLFPVIFTEHSKRWLLMIDSFCLCVWFLELCLFCIFNLRNFAFLKYYISYIYILIYLYSKYNNNSISRNCVLPYGQKIPGRIYKQLLPLSAGWKQKWKGQEILYVILYFYILIKILICAYFL